MFIPDCDTPAELALALLLKVLSRPPKPVLELSFWPYFIRFWGITTDALGVFSMGEGLIAGLKLISYAFGCTNAP
jgi:hypothetical protein